MPKNIYLNLFNLSCYSTRFSIKSLVWIHPLRNGVVERKSRHLLEITRALLFQMHVSKHFWTDAVSTACFLINRMSSSVLNWATPYHQLFPNNSLFPIDPKVFGCIYFIRDVRPQVSKLNLESFKCIFFWVILVFKKGIVVIVLLFDDTMSIDVTFFETIPFSLSFTVTSQGKDVDLLVNIISSSTPTPFPAPIPIKPPITQVYSRRTL